MKMLSSFVTAGFRFFNMWFSDGYTQCWKLPTNIFGLLQKRIEVLRTKFKRF